MKRIVETFNRACLCPWLLLVLLVNLLGLAPQLASAENLGNIMPLGNSITLGVPVAGGYRDPLYALLVNQGDTFTFVGSETGYSTANLIGAGQAHHEGHSGYVITNGTGRTGLHENLANWIGPGAAAPDKILLMIGTNDIDLNHDIANAPTRLRALVDRIYDYQPNVTLYLASIVPINDPIKNANVQAFNGAMPAIVTNQKALGRNVIYVPMYEALNVGSDLSDTLHPNVQGYAKMAQTWDTAIHASTNLKVEITAPPNNQTFARGTQIPASAAVANATGAYVVHIYTNSSSGAFAETGPGGSDSPYEISLGALPAGTYRIYASVTDTLSTAISVTNTFTVVGTQAGQQPLSFTGWNHDLIIGKTELAPLYSTSMASWNFYETGLAGSSQGLPADQGAKPRTFTCSSNAEVDFQFAPYADKNAVFISGVGSVTLTLNHPAKFHSLQFLNTARSMSWYAKLNFADGSSSTTTTWSDPDWTTSLGVSDLALTSYGLKSSNNGSFYTGYLWMAGHHFTLRPVDQTKILNTITITTTNSGDKQLALFGISGYVLESGTNIHHAVNLQSAGDGAGLGSSFSVGWDFTVSQTIEVLSLGQFDPDSNPTANSVAIYRRAGAKLVEAALLVTSPAEQSGNYSARYAAIDNLILTPGNYVVYSTQNGNNFIAPNGDTAALFGPAVKWNMGVATSGAAGPLPATAPAKWSIENSSKYRYFGPTFKYKIVIPPPILTLTFPAHNAELAVSEPVVANVTASDTVGAYTIHVYTNCGSGAFAEVGTGGSATPYRANLGTLAAGTYNIYASITDANATTNTTTNTFTVAVRNGQQTVALTGWNHDLIIGKTEPAPGYTTNMAGWNFYEVGLPGSTQGLPADMGDKPRSFYSTYNSNVQFQFASYSRHNTVYIDGSGSVTLSLVNPARFYSLQFLMTTREMSWYAKLNFADGSSAITPIWADMDWTGSGPGDTCLTKYGLKNINGSFFANQLWMAERGYLLSKKDRDKTINSITFHTTGVTGSQLALFAVSGHVLASSDNHHAVDLLSAGDGVGAGATYSVGWDFTVTDTITITSLGQFDPSSNPTANSVAIYHRAGAKLAEAVLLATRPSEGCGNYSARYVAVDNLTLAPGDYVVFSTQNGNPFIAGGGKPAASIGPCIIWNKGVAVNGAAGPLPITAPANWPIENNAAYRYFGPTFKYSLGTITPKGLLFILR